MPCYERDFAVAGRENAGSIKELADSLGASLFGIALLDTVRRHFHPSIIEAAGSMKYGISMGLRLSDAIIEDIKDEPTLIYKYHYSAVNRMLDQIALKVTNAIQKNGFNAMPIPASQIVDWEAQLGHLPHRAIACQAGLGWIGRSGLLISPQFGARVRYVTVLTDFPLEPDGPVEGDCGDCYKCLEDCPAGAITKEGYDGKKCLAELMEFAKKAGIGQYICGVCLKACPGQRRTR